MADRFDLDAIDADDALLDLLAAGGESARSAGEHDPAIALLAELRLAVEVEDELPVEKIDDAESFLARCATLNPITDPFARKVATRGLAFGVAAVAALSVSGVAAAVNGDPLSPYEKVIEKMVDAVRPQTSFPKEDLDGLPAIDKTKIVKVAKDFQAKQQQEKAQQDKSDSLLDQQPAAKKVTLTPPLVQPRQELPVAIQLQEQITPVEPQEPAKTVVDPKTTDQDKADQGKTTTDEPSTPTETTPPVDPTTPPPSETTTPPADPTTPPADTTSTTDPTTPPPTTGETGQTGNGSTSTGDPSTVPTEGSGTGSTGTDSTDTGSSNTGSSDTGSSNTGSSDTGSSDTGSSDTSSSDTGSSDTGTTGSTDTTSGLPADQSNDAPASDQPTALPTQSASALEKVVEQLRPVLPTPTGKAAENKSAERYFGDKHQAAGRHSTGALTEGSVKKSYTLGKHSTGHYAEGRHAAIHRAHGSTEDADVLKILGVVNKPTD